jgi:putative ABC transport system substrate-binding protein
VTEINPKRVQLLKGLVPRATRIAGLFNMSNPALPPQWKEVETAARSLGLRPPLLDVRTADELAPAFDAAVRRHADGLIVGLDTLTQANQRLIVEPAARHQLRAGCLRGQLSRHVSPRRNLRRQDPQGRPPGEPSGRKATTFEPVINLKTARALGLTIPPSLLTRADEVIQ